MYMPVGCTCNGGTQLSMFHGCLYYIFMIFANNTVFAFAFVLTMLCLLHCLAPHNPGILLVTFLSLTFVHV